MIRCKYLTFFPHFLFQDPKNLPTGLPANLVSLMSKGTLGATKLTEVSKTPKMDTETPAQKQAAAKLALRKQLEKTLLQVCYANFSVKRLRLRKTYDMAILIIVLLSSFRYPHPNHPRLRCTSSPTPRTPSSSAC